MVLLIKNVRLRSGRKVITRMKKMLFVIVGLIVITVSAVNVYINSQNDGQSAFFRANVSALTTESLTTESEWLGGMTTGSITIGTITIPCCVQSSSTNGCDFGNVGCAHYNL
jgi:hypothetical protein